MGALLRFSQPYSLLTNSKPWKLEIRINPKPFPFPPALRYEVRVPKEETTMVSDLRYGWKKLRKLSTDTTDNLTRLQAGFKRELIKEVKVFVVDAQHFRKEWEVQGPMVPGLDPMDAVDRLRKFQQMFEVRAALAGREGEAPGWSE